MEVLIVITWLALCGAAAYIAGNKGRSGVGIFFLSLFLSPIVGVIVALGMNPNVEKVAVAQGKKRCPNCAEFVQPDAKTCRFCQHSFVEEEAAERVRLEAERVRLEAEQAAAAARRQAEYEAHQAAEAAKPWLRRNAVPLAFVFLFIAFFGGLIWYAVKHPIPVQPVVEKPVAPAAPTWVGEERSKVPKSVWDMRVAWAIQHHCYFKAMSRHEIVQALGTPTEEQPSSLTYSRQTRDCARYEVNGDACVEYKAETRTIFLADGYEDQQLSFGHGCRTLYGDHEYSGLAVPNFDPPKAARPTKGKPDSDIRP